MKTTLVKASARDLTVVPHLQRTPPNPGRVAKMKKAWDPALVGVLEAAEMRHNGEVIWHITDGQTRWTVGKMIDPDYEFDVVVVYDMSEKEIAAFFLARNQLNANVPAFDQYRVGLVAEDEIALTVKAALDAKGLDVSSGADARHIGAVGALMNIVRSAKRTLRSRAKAQIVLERTLETVRQAWPSEGATRFNGDVLKAVAIFYTKWPDRFTEGSADEERLIKKLEKRDTEAWTSIAAARQTNLGGGEGRALALHRTWLDQFNGRLSRANKLS